MDTYWVPGVNNLGAYGRWAFAELTDGRWQSDPGADQRRGRLPPDGEAAGTIENTDLMPAALLVRFGRAAAEQAVEHIEERMAAPRRRGFRARFAGRELRPGQERDFALGFLTQFAQPMGMGPAGGGNQMAYGMGSHRMHGSGGQVDAEVGYGLPVGTRFVGTPLVGVSTSQYGRDYRVGSP